MVIALIWLRTTETGLHSSQKQALWPLWKGKGEDQCVNSFLGFLQRVPWWTQVWKAAPDQFSNQILTAIHTHLHQHICRKKCDSEVIQGKDSPERKSRPVLHVFVTQPYWEQVYNGKNEGWEIRVQQEPPSNSRIWKEMHKVRIPRGKAPKQLATLTHARPWQEVPGFPVDSGFLSTLTIWDAFTHQLKQLLPEQIHRHLVFSLDLSNLSIGIFLTKLGTSTFSLKGGSLWFSLQ